MYVSTHQWSSRSKNKRWWLGHQRIAYEVLDIFIVHRVHKSLFGRCSRIFQCLFSSFSIFKAAIYCLELSWQTGSHLMEHRGFCSFKRLHLPPTANSCSQWYRKSINKTPFQSNKRSQKPYRLKDGFRPSRAGFIFHFWYWSIVMHPYFITYHDMCQKSLFFPLKSILNSRTDLQSDVFLINNFETHFIEGKITSEDYFTTSKVIIHF